MKTLVPQDTGRKLNVHKTFRRRPGHLLNALCTFNLRPVSRGFQSLFLIKLLAPAALLKKRLWHSCFPVNFAKSLSTLFLRNISGSCFLSIPQATHKLPCGEYEYIYLEPKNCLTHEKCVINLGLSWKKVVLKMSAKFLKNVCKGVLFSI